MSYPNEYLPVLCLGLDDFKRRARSFLEQEDIPQFIRLVLGGRTRINGKWHRVVISPPLNCVSPIFATYSRPTESAGPKKPSSPADPRTKLSCVSSPLPTQVADEIMQGIIDDHRVRKAEVIDDNGDEAARGQRRATHAGYEGRTPESASLTRNEEEEPVPELEPEQSESDAAHESASARTREI